MLMQQIVEWSYKQIATVFQIPWKHLQLAIALVIARIDHSKVVSIVLVTYMIITIVAILLCRRIILERILLYAEILRPLNPRN